MALVATSHAQHESIRSQVEQPETDASEHKLVESEIPETSQRHRDLGYDKYKKGGKMGDKGKSDKKGYAYEPWIHAPVSPPVPPPVSFIHYYPKTVDPYYYYPYKGKGGGKMDGGKMGSGKMNSYKDYGHDEWYVLPKTHEPYAKEYYSDEHYYKTKGSGKMGGSSSYKGYAHDKWYALPKTHEPYAKDYYPKQYHPKTVDPYEYINGKGSGKMGGGKMDKGHYYADPWIHPPVPPPVPPPVVYIPHHPKTVDPYYYYKGKDSYGGKMYGGKMDGGKMSYRS